MPHKKSKIPVRSLASEFGQGIAVAKVSQEVFHADAYARRAHRHDYHFFVLQEKGVSVSEIDFTKYVIRKPSVLYQSPNQVHRALKVDNIEMYILIIDSEHLNVEYLKLLQTISPAKPLVLNAGDLPIIQRSFSLCAELYERKQDRLYFASLRDCCNTLAALIISQYLVRTKPPDAMSRFEKVEKAFSASLERNFHHIKRPAGYAEKLNISVAYLNECVKQTTGFSVSHQVHQRVILEAKRLLYYSAMSIKEIAMELGYEDYAYFSRLFSKVTGMSAVAFRNKNHD